MTTNQTQRMKKAGDPVPKGRRQGAAAASARRKHLGRLSCLALMRRLAHLHIKRLDSLSAGVANFLLSAIDDSANRRLSNARFIADLALGHS